MLLSTVLLGLLSGFLLNLIIRITEDKRELFLIVIGMVILSVGGASYLNVSPLLMAAISGVVLAQPGAWTLGALANNVWSFAGDADAPDVNQGSFQYFIVYQLGKGWYLNSAPIITVNWEADSGQKWKVPFDAEGNMMEYASTGFYAAHTWRDNYRFSSAMRYSGYSKGRSAVRFHFRGSDGKEYTMSLGEFDRLMKHSGCPHAHACHPVLEWTFVKRGQNYSLSLAKNSKLNKDQSRENRYGPG